MWEKEIKGTAAPKALYEVRERGAAIIQKVCRYDQLHIKNLGLDNIKCRYLLTNGILTGLILNVNDRDT